METDRNSGFPVCAVHVFQRLNTKSCHHLKHNRAYWWSVTLMSLPPHFSLLLCKGQTSSCLRVFTSTQRNWAEKETAERSRVDRLVTENRLKGEDGEIDRAHRGDVTCSERAGRFTRPHLYYCWQVVTHIVSCVLWKTINSIRSRRACKCIGKGCGSMKVWLFTFEQKKRLLFKYVDWEANPNIEIRP